MFDMMLRCASIVSELKHVKAVVLKDLGKVPLDGEVTTITRGQEVELPKWLANFLATLGYVELREQHLTIDEVSRDLMSEKGLGKSSLVKLRDDFYSEAKELLSRVKSGSLSNIDAAINAVRLESNLRDLMRLRLNKIVSIASLGVKVEKFEDNLTIEELVLFNFLTRIISEWLNQLKQ